MESPMNKRSMPPFFASATLASCREIQLVGKSRGTGISEEFSARTWNENKMASQKAVNGIFIRWKILSVRTAHRHMGVFGDGLRAGADVELFVHAADVGVDGLHADLE